MQFSTGVEWLDRLTLNVVGTNAKMSIWNVIMMSYDDYSLKDGTEDVLSELFVFFVII